MPYMPYFGVLSQSKFNVPIVTTMELTYTFNNSTKNWSFNLNGVTTTVRDLLLDGYSMRVQLVRYQRHNRRQPVGQLSGKIKPTFPSFLGHVGGLSVLQSKIASINITEFINNNFTGMNLTTWVNDMFRWGSANYDSQSQSAYISTNINLNGFWFQEYSFCILINNQKISTSGTVIRVNMTNEGNTNINTNYTLTNNELTLSAN